MKAYTDVNQSKKLAEKLPIESADLWWAERYVGYVDESGHYIVEENPVFHISLVKPSDNNYSQDTIKDIPCWSLFALLAQMPGVELVSSNDGHYRVFWHEMYSEWHTNAVDACVELILRERKEEENEST